MNTTRAKRQHIYIRIATLRFLIAMAAIVLMLLYAAFSRPDAVAASKQTTLPAARSSAGPAASLRRTPVALIAL